MCNGTLLLWMCCSLFFSNFFEIFLSSNVPNTNSNAIKIDYQDV